MTDVFHLLVHCHRIRQDNQGTLDHDYIGISVSRISLIIVFSRASDLYMKGIQNAKERDPTDWAQLF